MTKLTDSNRLRSLADWFDKEDASGRTYDKDPYLKSGSNAVQELLRRIADNLEEVGYFPEIRIYQALMQLLDNDTVVFTQLGLSSYHKNIDHSKVMIQSLIEAKDEALKRKYSH